jgi:ATP-dependent exoDNAse (exonuclease V) alpha subunit
VGGAELSVSDRIVFLRNDNVGREVVNVEPASARGVRNGALGSVVEAAPQRITVRLDDGRTVAFDPNRYAAVGHGYAVTVHKAQGATVDRSYVLAEPLMNRSSTYVALTRHWETVQLYADRETFPARTHPKSGPGHGRGATAADRSLRRRAAP